MRELDFNSMDRQSKAGKMWTDGKKIFEFKGKNYNHIIYQIEYFYVEVQYYKDSYSIADIKALITYEDWKPFLDVIPLHEMMH